VSASIGKRNRWDLWGIVVFLLFLAAAGADYAINGREAKEMQAALEREFSALSPPRGAYLVYQTASSKPREANVGRSYRAYLTDAAITDYYGSRLLEHGWRPCNEGSVTNGASIVYCKGQFAATLTLVDGGSSWNYALELTWGPRT